MEPMDDEELQELKEFCDENPYSLSAAHGGTIAVLIEELLAFRKQERDQLAKTPLQRSREAIERETNTVIWDNLNAIADTYEEEGNEAMALGYRWLARHRSMPQIDDEVCYWSNHQLPLLDLPSVEMETPSKSFRWAAESIGLAILAGELIDD